MEARYITASDARDEFSEVLNRVSYGHERVVVQRRGKDLAAMVPMEDLRLLERLVEDAEDRIDVAEAERILADPTEERIPRSRVQKRRRRD